MRLRFRPLRERLDRFAPGRPGRVFGGRRAVAGGQRAEDLIQWALRRLDEQGRAWVKKTEPPTGIDAKGRRFFKRKGAPDFMGALPGGRHIVFEAKSTRERTFRWPEGTHQTRERQVADLGRAGGVYGALAGILLLFWPPAAQGRTYEGIRPRLIWVHWAGLRALAQGAWSADELCGQPWAQDVAWPTGEDPLIIEAAVEAERRWNGWANGEDLG